MVKPPLLEPCPLPDEPLPLVPPFEPALPPEPELDEPPPLLYWPCLSVGFPPPLEVTPPPRVL